MYLRIFFFGCIQNHPYVNKQKGIDIYHIPFVVLFNNSDIFSPKKKNLGVNHFAGDVACDYMLKAEDATRGKRGKLSGSYCRETCGYGKRGK